MNAPVDTAAHAAALNALALHEPRVAAYAWGQRVIALDDLVNDGSYPERAVDAVLAERGAVGEIVNVGHATESNESIYLVEFVGCVIGCFEDEIAPAPLGLLPETDEVQGG
ncbi:nitrogen fixation protein NifZ [Variovorax ginsengisoli]|uniref:Nitrogen fixation protein NifZ n=1 Tax=Variovorax ginsengisoli TaxID=363844 RepID=A0ABT9SEJ2_9BURK|nr:nitrogen fixation protein NifZ [Variovorax ginsengisoli]MDP9902775.1 nitrogen fixation protein NifZ [Variovorax ginsengisoli]